MRIVWVSPTQIYLLCLARPYADKVPVLLPEIRLSLHPQEMFCFDLLLIWVRTNLNNINYFLVLEILYPNSRQIYDASNTNIVIFTRNLFSLQRKQILGELLTLKQNKLQLLNSTIIYIFHFLPGAIQWMFYRRLFLIKSTVSK